MPVGLELLKRRGVTTARLSVLFTPDLKPDPNSFDPAEAKRAKITKEDIDRVGKLHNRIRSRVQEGMARNLKTWRVYHALDLARNTPFRQVTPTLLQSLVGDGNEVFKTGDEVFKKLEALGLGEDTFVSDELDEKGGKTGKRRINVPAFFSILVPLVKSYTDLVWSKIVNERDLNPLFEWRPSYSTAINKAKCKVLTDRAQVVAVQYSFFEVLKQCCLKMVHYGTCLQFPKEEWHSQKQVEKRKATALDVKNEVRNENGAIVAEGDEIEAEFVEREGLRYHLPHPTRTFRDLAHSPYTYNSDCGAMFAGYWQIVRYKDICGIGYWNADKIRPGINYPLDYSAFFQTVYAACTMKMPSGAAAAAEVGLGGDRHDSEKQLANDFYGTDQNDQGVLVTEYFEKLIPSENGLGNYTNPVWFRFVLAGDGCTVLYAAPLPYAPVIYWGYNPDESQDQNSSVALEVLPFQDHFGILLSQIILSAKQNLANLTFVNTEIMDQKDIDDFSNKGERLYRKVNVIGKAFKKLSKALGLKKYETEDAIQSWTLPKANIAELVGVLKTILDVCDRVMQVSSQEMARQATHEQSKGEVEILSEATQARNRFVGKSVDLAVDAWKRQIYLALMEYGDPEFYAHIPVDPELTPEQLQTLGFVVAGARHPDDDFIRVRVKTSAINHPLHEFASTATDLDRKSDPKMAAAMAQLLQPMMQNSALLQIIGPKQILDLTNRIAHMAGVDRDFILRPVGPLLSPEEQKQQAEAQLKQTIDLISRVVDQKLMKDITPMLQMLKESEAVISLLVHTLNIPKELIDQTLATVDKPQQPNQQPNNAPAPAPSGPVPG
jgi:hypothetical protein